MPGRKPTPPLPEEQFGRNAGRMLEASAYLTLAGGYLVGILTAQHLTLLGFALLTAGNLAWAYLFYRMSSGECSTVEAILLTAGMIVLNALVLQLPRLGIGFDWLLPIVTIGILGVMFEARIVIGIGTGILLLLSLSLLSIENGWDANFLQSELTLLPAGIFVVAFTIVLRQQYVQRSQAEALVTQLEEAQRQLRRYASEVEELTITRERNGMAREIHDTLGHYLTILAVKLETATKLEEHGDARLHAELVEARRVASECLLEVRRSVAALRPAAISEMQLNEAIPRLVAEFEATTPDTSVTLDAEGEMQRLTPELRLALYRCAQESLTNIRKHAHASKVLLRLRIEAAQVELLVRDNGIGAASGEPEQGFGLLGMRERIALLGGTVSAGPDSEQGWRVVVSFPIPGHADNGTSPLALGDVTSQELAATGKEA